VRVIDEIERLEGGIRLLEHRTNFAVINVSFEFRDRNAPARSTHSNFSWLNTLDLVRLQADFQYHSGWSDSENPGYLGQAPEGFSTYRGKKALRAVSPDNVVFRVRAEDHEPEAELDFWHEAMRQHLEVGGYRFLRESDIKAGEVTGILLEFTAPLGPVDYSYAVALFPTSRRLLIAEAAGPIEAYEARRAAVVEALGSLEL